MEVDYLAIVRQAFAGGTIQDFDQYQKLMNIKRKLKSQAQIKDNKGRKYSSSSESKTSPRQTPEEEMSPEVQQSSQEIGTAPQAAPARSKKYHIIEQVEQINHKKQHKEEEAAESIESTFNSLSGLQVFKIYTDQNFFRQILENRKECPREIDQLLWRITYLVGEIVMLAQTYLIEQQIIRNDSVLTIKEIGEASFKIVNLDLQKSIKKQETQLKRVKVTFLQVFQEGQCNKDKALKILNFVKTIRQVPAESEKEEKGQKRSIKIEQKQSKFFEKTVQTDPIELPLPYPQPERFQFRPPQSQDQYRSNLSKVPKNSYQIPQQMEVSQVAAFNPSQKQPIRRPVNNLEPQFRNYQKYTPMLQENFQNRYELNPQREMVQNHNKTQLWSPFANSHQSFSQVRPSNQSFQDLLPPKVKPGGKKRGRKPKNHNKIQNDSEVLQIEDGGHVYQPKSPKNGRYTLPGISCDQNPIQQFNNASNYPQFGVKSRDPPKDLDFNRQSKGYIPPQTINKQSYYSNQALKNSEIFQKKDKGPTSFPRPPIQQQNKICPIDLNEEDPFSSQLANTISIPPVVVPVIAPATQSKDSIKKEEFKKQMREKWTPEEEALLVDTFIEKGDEQICSKILGQRFGEHPKWSTGGVKLRLDWIVRKVHDKFKSLTTKNESINRFKDNWEFISKKSSLPVRKKIFQNIVAIYTAMLHMSEQKKEIISRKITEINRICQLENTQPKQ